MEGEIEEASTYRARREDCAHRLRGTGQSAQASRVLLVVDSPSGIGSGLGGFVTMGGFKSLLVFVALLGLVCSQDVLKPLKCPYPTYTKKMKLLPNKPRPASFLGQYVQVTDDGEYIFGGAYGYAVKTNYEGAVYVFKKKPDGTFKAKQRLTSDTPTQSAYFGLNLHARGNLLWVGSPFTPTYGRRSGASFVFTRQSDGRYSQTQRLIAPRGSGHGGAYFGYSGQITSDSMTIFVGSRRKNNDELDLFAAGAVYHFNWDGSEWKFFDLISSEAASSQFSDELRTEGDLLLIGSPRAEGGTGLAFIYKKGAGGKYKKMQVLEPVAPPKKQLFRAHFSEGLSISSDLKWIAIGGETAPSPVGRSTGAAWIFKLNPGTGMYDYYQPIWPEVKRDNALKFGQRLQIDNNMLVIGAWFGNHQKVKKGVTYVYHLCDRGNWRLRSKLQLNKGGREDDQFGKCVSFNKDYIVIGATKRDINTTSGGQEGAVYVYPYQVVCPKGTCPPV